MKIESENVEREEVEATRLGGGDALKSWDANVTPATDGGAETLAGHLVEDERNVLRFEGREEGSENQWIRSGHVRRKRAISSQ